MTNFSIRCEVNSLFFSQHLENFGGMQTAYSLNACYLLVVQPGEEKPAGRPYCGFQYLKSAYRKDGENLFSKSCCDWTRSNGFKLRGGRFRLDIRNKFLQ